MAATRPLRPPREQRHHHEATGGEAQDLLDVIAMLAGPALRAAAAIGPLRRGHTAGPVAGDGGAEPAHMSASWDSDQRFSQHR